MGYTGQSDPMIRVLCVEDHRLVLQGITLIIDSHADLKVVAAAETGEQAVDLFRAHRPDVTLMDLQLPGLGGLEAIRVIRTEDPDARIIVVTMYEGDEDIYRALQAGATTYLLKDTISDDLTRTIRQVYAGERPIRPDIESRLAERSGRAELTDRELQVLALVSEGLRNKEIAIALGITEETTQVHVKRILTKLGVHDRTAAVRAALRRGIIHLK